MPNSISRCLFWLLCSTLLITISCAVNFYQLLDVDRNADIRTIRKAFKKLAISKHPDKNTDDPNAHSEFIVINRAYEVLKDVDLRAKYDKYGEKGLKNDFQAGGHYQSWSYYKENFGIYDDDLEIVTLDRNNFHHTVFNSGELWFVNFYSTFCSHCHYLAPTWRQVAKKLNGVIKIGAVNCAEDPNLCSWQKVFNYPSLVIYPQGEFYADGQRDFDSLISFVMARINDSRDPPVVFFTPEQFDAKVLARNKTDTFLVDFFAPWCRPCQELAPQFLTLARILNTSNKNITLGARFVPRKQTYYIGRRGRNGIRRQPVFPQQIWNVYDRTLNGEDRTNNYAEAVHRRLQSMLQIDHPTIWKLIDGLKKIQKSRDIDYERMIAGNRPQKKRRKYLQTDQRILEIVRDYDNRNIIEYLRGLAHNFEMED